jgi:hypothetical protein
MVEVNQGNLKRLLEILCIFEGTTTMKKKLRYLSDNSLLALYFALHAARKGASRVYVSNEVLRVVTGKQKAHKEQIREFATTMKPIFPRYALGKQDYNLKSCLFLYFNEKKTDAERDKAKIITERVTGAPAKSEIDETLSVQLIEVSL